jgi:hypothetical protein
MASASQQNTEEIPTLDSLLRNTRDDDARAVLVVLNRMVEYTSQTCAVVDLLGTMENLEAIQVRLLPVHPKKKTDVEGLQPKRVNKFLSKHVEAKSVHQATD